MNTRKLKKKINTKTKEMKKSDQSRVKASHNSENKNKII